MLCHILHKISYYIVFFAKEGSVTELYAFDLTNEVRTRSYKLSRAWMVHVDSSSSHKLAKTFSAAVTVISGASFSTCKLLIFPSSTTAAKRLDLVFPSSPDASKSSPSNLMNAPIFCHKSVIQDQFFGRGED